MRQPRRLAWLFLLPWMPLTVAHGADVKLQQPKIFENASGEKLPYLLHVPEGATVGEPLPLVVFLHGAGERGHDGKLQMKHRQVLDLLTAKGSPPAIFVAPQCPPDEKWSNVHWGSEKPEPQDAEPTRPMRLLLELLDALAKDLPIDPSRRYVTGLSMGGFGTFEAGPRGHQPLIS